MLDVRRGKKFFSVLMAVLAVFLGIAGGFFFRPAGRKDPALKTGVAGNAVIPAGGASTAGGITRENGRGERGESGGSVSRKEASPLIEKAVDVQADLQAAKVAARAAAELHLEKIKGEADRLFEQEDEIYRSRPRYEEETGGIRAEALVLLAQKGIEPADGKAAILLAREELDAFWKEGGLSSPSAYRHGYLARAILEEAIEADGASFAVLDMLKETITSTNMLYFHDGGSNEYAVNLLWNVAGKEKAMIDRGEQPADTAAFYAMLDWTMLTGKKTGRAEEGLPGWKWLLDNSARGGWSALDPILGEMAKTAEQGRSERFCPYVLKLAPGEEADREFIRSLRRLESFQGPTPEIRALKVNRWEKNDRSEAAQWARFSMKKAGEKTEFVKEGIVK